jgi:methylglutaconyl-CoA hydratase
MEHITYEVRDRIAEIVLNRPEKRNAFNGELIAELRQAFTQAEQDETVKVIRLSAEGKIFSAGADLGYIQAMQAYTYEQNLEDSTNLMELYQQIYTHPKIVVAQIQGSAIAGGCGLATVCDFSFAVDTAEFGYTEVKIGFVPALVMVFLLRKIGEGRAKELLLTGKLISAKAALEMGLINEVLPADALVARVDAFLAELCTGTSAQSLQMTKQMIAKVQDLPLREGLLFAAQSNAQARSSTDLKNGIQAFLNKQKIRW